MKPKQLKVANGNFQIVWSDEDIWTIPVTCLRDECPCAGCKGETILLHTYLPPKAEKSPDSYMITGIKPVGGYAIQISWKDGHDTGLYSWEYLKQLVKDQADSTKQDYEPLL